MESRQNSNGSYRILFDYQREQRALGEPSNEAYASSCAALSAGGDDDFSGEWPRFPSEWPLRR
jgi:hypothetical protein